MQKNCFRECSSLSTVKFGNINSIGESCFKDCISLKDIELPEGLETVDWMAFSGTGLTKLRFPDSIHRIESYALETCPNLKKIFYSYGYIKCSK